MTIPLAVGHYVMGLVFFIYVDRPETAAMFLVTHAVACALLGWRRPSPAPLIALGALAATLGTQHVLPIGAAGLPVTALGCAGMNVGLADLLAVNDDPSATTLRAQAFVAGGNGTAPVLWGLVGTAPAVSIASVAALAVVAMVLAGAFNRSRPSYGQSSSVGLSAILSGLAVGTQVVLVGSVPALLEPTLMSAVTLGGGVGIVIGRVVASRWPTLVRPDGLRLLLFVGGLASITIMSVEQPLVVGFLTLVATASIGPMFPLAMAASYGRGSSPGEALARGPGLVIGTASLMAALAPIAATFLADLGAAATLAGIAALLVILGLVAPRQYDRVEYQEAE